MARPVVDETGNTYGKLKVLSESKGEHRSTNKHWLCKCSCGREVTVNGASLRDGLTRSCGCLTYERRPTRRKSEKPTGTDKKNCTKCDNPYLVTSFPVRRWKQGEPVYMTWCHRCLADYAKKRKQDHPEIRERHNKRTRELAIQDPRYRLLRCAKERAQREGVPFSLSIEDITVPKTCPVFPHIKLQVGEGKLHDGSPTLDKVIPELGYIPSNVVVVSFKANRMKSNSTIQELIQLANFYATIGR